MLVAVLISAAVSNILRVRRVGVCLVEIGAELLCEADAVLAGWQVGVSVETRWLTKGGRLRNKPGGDAHRSWH